jgi:endogenous inhibitor of DNA gyrase (YacG/DUF329 family)
MLGEVTLRCPICNRSSRPRAYNRAFPFCSERCKLIDLGKWLSEEYRVPVHDEPPDESGAAGERPNEEKR